MSTVAIVVIGAVSLLAARLVSMRISAAGKRRVVKAVRDRLAAGGEVRRQAKVVVMVSRTIGGSVSRATWPATCALTADGLYCISEDGTWGECVRFAPGAPDVGDVVMTDRPSLILNGSLADPNDPVPSYTPRRAAFPLDGLMLPLQGGLSWIISFAEAADAEQWHAALMRQSRG